MAQDYRITIIDDNGKSVPAHAVRWNHADAMRNQSRDRKAAAAARAAKAYRESDADLIGLALAMLTTD